MLKMSPKVEAVVSALMAGESLPAVSARFQLAKPYVWQIKERHCREEWARARLERKLRGE
jgi:hypothetical protein